MIRRWRLFHVITACEGKIKKSRVLVSDCPRENKEDNGLTIRPWAPFLLSFYLFLWRLATDGKEEPAVCQRLALNNFSISCLFHRLTPDRSSKQPDGALSRVIEHTCNGSRDSSPANHVITHNLWNSFQTSFHYIWYSSFIFFDSKYIFQGILIS